MPRTVKAVSVVPQLPPRARDAHKGSFGHVLVVGGSVGMIGAPALSALAALRGGAGLATLAVPARIQQAAAALCPCATSVPLECDAAGEPTAGAVRQMLEHAAGCDVLAVGPGMGVSLGASQLVRAAIGQDKPVVLDADGLNNLTKMDGWPALRRCPLVLTPHPGEFGRLTGKPVKEIQADRENLAVAAAAEWQAAAPAVPLVLLLKGAGTVVVGCTPKQTALGGGTQRVHINRTGNPGMATGGTGDVLTGLIAALIGQRLSPFDAACLGAYLHGLAGDLAAKKLGQVSLIATDLIDFLPAAFLARQRKR